jgi:hypothetical protein
MPVSHVPALALGYAERRAKKFYAAHIYEQTRAASFRRSNFIFTIIIP